MPILERIFPPFGLRLSCGPLVLTHLRDADLAELTDLPSRGIVEPDSAMPFLLPWHEEPDDIRPLHSARFYWRKRASFCPEEWHLMFVVRRNDEVLGVQDLLTKSDFRQTRSLETASWLALPYHHQGAGTLMRRMVASFAFDQLGATELTSCYLDGNLASAAVSRKLGYRPNGARRVARQDGWVLEHHVRLEPQDFVHSVEPVRYEGVAEFRAFIGLD